MSPLPYSVRGSTGGYTLEGSEPQPTAGPAGDSGWYTFTPTALGYYQFNLSGSLYPTSVAVYQQLGTGIAGLSEVGSNQSVAKTNSYVFLFPGTQYWIQVASQGAADGAIFQLNVAFISPNCMPSQCEGYVVANFWSGWNGSGSPGIVGGYGGTPEVARATCPMGWNSVTVKLTLDSSTNPNAIWYLGWEFHDIHDQLLGNNRGSFFGPGISSWQNKGAVGVGGTTVSTITYTPSFGGDTNQAHWFIIYGFPTDPRYGAPRGHIHGEATYVGPCYLPDVPSPRHNQVWWA